MKHKDWVRVRNMWVKQNPPNHEGHYVCGICGKTLDSYSMELDHITPRSGNPMSSSDFSNLQPTHPSCNQMKGSRRWKPVISQEEYRFRNLLDL